MCTCRESSKIHTGGGVRTSGRLTQRKKELFSASCGLRALVTVRTTNGHQPSLNFKSQDAQTRRSRALLRLCGSRGEGEREGKGGGGREREDKGRRPHLRTRETPTLLPGHNPHVGC